MAETTIADALEREHRDIDAGLEEFHRGLDLGESRVEALRRASRALRRHIYIEEEVLFPPLRAGGMYGPVTVMLMEHAAIWRGLDELEALVDAGGEDRAAIDRAMASLSQVLEEHNSKEELIVYPQADVTPNEEVRRQVIDLLERGELPEGWVCQRLAAEA